MHRLAAFFCIVACFSVQALHLEAQSRSAIDNAMSQMDSAFNAVEAEASQQDAYYLGRAVAANILSVYKPYTRNPELTRYLNRICQTIVINSSQPELYNGYHVIILDSPEYNAFATPGGHIFITIKLIETASSEDMLAAIIAHEISHIILKHGLSIIDEMKIANEASSMAGQAAAFSGRNANTDRFMQFRNSIAKSLDTLMKNGYSQTQEFDADRQAVELLVKSGYNPGALVDVLKILQKSQSSQQGGFNSTHPSPAERISNAEKIRVRSPQDTRRFRIPRFKERFPAS